MIYFLRFTVGHVCHSHIDRAVTYPWLQNVIEQLENTPQIPEVVELIEFCKVFIDKNYFYSPIVKVQHKKEKVEVYDFNIPGGSFIS